MPPHSARSSLVGGKFCGTVGKLPSAFFLFLPSFPWPTLANGQARVRRHL